MRRCFARVKCWSVRPGEIRLAVRAWESGDPSRKLLWVAVLRIPCRLGKNGDRVAAGN